MSYKINMLDSQTDDLSLISGKHMERSDFLKLYSQTHTYAHKNKSVTFKNNVKEGLGKWHIGYPSVFCTITRI